MKKGSVLLFALFLIMFVFTIVTILYIANKRYVLLAKTERENFLYSAKYESKLFSLYVLNAFVRKGGVIRVDFDVSKIYDLYNSVIKLYNYQMDITNKRIYYNIENNFIYSKIYDNDQLMKHLKLFNYTVDNLYKYDGKTLIYMPSEIKKFFESENLNRSELEVIKKYCDYLKEGIADTMALTSQDKQTIVVKYNYKPQENYNSSSVNRYSRRKVYILISFTKSRDPFYLTVDIELENQIKGLNLGYENNEFYGVSFINTKIYNVTKSSVRRGFSNDIMYPYELRW